ncbi:MAG: CbtA family protein [Sneathiella sp.]|nr:CbtA family protein [Sneathiella sp.]
MLMRFLWAGLMAGLLAGVPAAAIQHFTTTPLIIHAEMYEHAEHSDHAALEGAAGMQDGKVMPAGYILAHGPAAEEASGEWAPDDGLERTFYTSIATVITAIGYAFMLLAAMFLAKSEITPRTGLLWGLAGFAAAGLAPSLGLSPELPGSAAAGLLSRQIWWTTTVVTTAGGLWLILRVSSPLAIIVGVVLMVVPHLIGAPHPEVMTSEVPSELAAHFAASSLVLHAIVWALAGVAAGFMWQRGETPAEL